LPEATGNHPSSDIAAIKRSTTPGECWHCMTTCSQNQSACEGLEQLGLWLYSATSCPCPGCATTHTAATCQVSVSCSWWEARPVCVAAAGWLGEGVLNACMKRCWQPSDCHARMYTMQGASVIEPFITKR
jgi:hypothetical protein